MEAIIIESRPLNLLHRSVCSMYVVSCSFFQYTSTLSNELQSWKVRNCSSSVVVEENASECMRDQLALRKKSNLIITSKAFFPSPPPRAECMKEAYCFSTMHGEMKFQMQFACENCPIRVITQLHGIELQLQQQQPTAPASEETSKLLPQKTSS